MTTSPEWLSPNRYKGLRPVGLALAAALGLSAAATLALPKTYVASARVLVPPEAGDIAPLASAAAARDIAVSAAGGSRLALLTYASADPRKAASVVNDFVAAHAKRPMVVIDRASVPRRAASPDLLANLGYGAVAGLALGLCLVSLRREKAEPALARESSVPQPEGPHELCRRLLAEWFVSHPMLVIVGTGTREARAKAAARLAVGFAELGAKTLLADAELADPPPTVQIKPVDKFDGLYLLLAPRERLAAVIAEAGRRYRVVLIDSPAGEHRFAALAGGALVVTQPGDEAAADALEAALASRKVLIAGRLAVADERQKESRAVVNT